MYQPRLKEKYFKEVVQKLKEQFGYKSVMQVPRCQKICINQGLGAAIANPKLMEVAVDEMAAITGQKPVIRKSKKSIAQFKLRTGMPIGLSVTLRGDKMYEFMDRLITVSLARISNFGGISNDGFDAQGNYTLGIREQIIFPEISMEKIVRMTGMNITFVTSTPDPVVSKALLAEMGLPFRK